MLLFNTKGNKVRYRKLDRMYINPMADISERCPRTESRKRLLILNMSSTNSECDLFNRLEESCRRTWAKPVIDGAYPNISYWKVVDGGADSVDRATLTVTVAPRGSMGNIQQLLHRYVRALGLLRQTEGFDYVLRTNTSTWVNVGLLDDFLAGVTDPSVSYTSCLYCAFWSTFHLYMSGNAMLMSKDTADTISEVSREQGLLDVGDVMDDVMMSSIIYARCEQLGIPETKKMRALGCVHHRKPLAETDMASVDFTAPFHQVKTFGDAPHATRVVDDVAKMEALQRAFEDAGSPEPLDGMLSRDTPVYMMPFSKAEFARMGADDRRDVQFSRPMPLDEAYMLGRALMERHYRNK